VETAAKFRWLSLSKPHWVETAAKLRWLKFRQAQSGGLFRNHPQWKPPPTNKPVAKLHFTANNGGKVAKASEKTQMVIL
jgi:hypothetical protein